MTDFKINNYILQQEAQRLAQECLDEHGTSDSLSEPSELLWETCLDHEWSIYTYKALLLCAECDTSEGEDYLKDLDIKHDSLADHASALAFHTLYCAAINALEELQQEA